MIIAERSQRVVHSDASYLDNHGVEAISAASATRFMASLIAMASLLRTAGQGRKPRAAAGQGAR